jgi:hypothetical protein
MMVLKRIFLGALLGGLPGVAVAWVADNRQTVNPVTDTVFEVVAKAGSGGMDFWCAAGDYARRALGAPPTQRVYVVRERGAAVTLNRRSAAHFSLLAPEGADTAPGIFLSVTRVGENLSAAAAQAYCSELKNYEN